MRSKWLRGFLMAGIAACMLLVVALAGTFSVTLPTALPVSVDADGNVTTAEPIIKNTGSMTITVASATVEPLDGWTIVPWETDFGKLPVNSKKFAMSFYGSKVPADGVIKLPSQSTIPVGGSAAVVYDARIAVQAAAAEDLTIANCCIVVDSDEPEVPTGAVMAANSSWYKSSTKKASITEIEIVDSYTPTGEETESWDASDAGDGSVMAYLNGTKLTLAGNGTGKIYANPDASWAFSDAAALSSESEAEMDLYASVTSISGLELLDTSDVTNASGMFTGCGYAASEGLTISGLAGWDTSKMVNMSYMFALCAETRLNLGSWDTSAVTDMMLMLASSGHFEELDFSGWDTSSVTSMNGMFGDCFPKKIILGEKFTFTGGGDNDSYLSENATWQDTITGTVYTTAELYAVTRTGKVTYLARYPAEIASGDSWYKGATARTAITEIELADSYTPTGEETESWDASAAGDGSVMAYISGTKLTLAGNGTGKICANSDASWMFSDSNAISTGNPVFYQSLTSIKGLELLDTSSVTTALGMFGGCGYASGENLILSNLTGWDTSKITDMSYMFASCSVAGLDLSRWDMSSCTNINGMFSGTTNLFSIDLSAWDTSSIEDMGSVFSSSSVTDVDLSNWDTSSAVDMSWMFANSKFAELDLSGWDTSAVTNMNYMFSNASLRRITLGANFKPVGSNNYLFGNSGAVWEDVQAGKKYTQQVLCTLTRTVPTTYVSIPTLSSGGYWCSKTAYKSTVTEIELMDKYTPTGAETESWDASAAKNKNVMAYIIGTKLILAGDGSGEIFANPYSASAFSGFTVVQSISGLELLNTSVATNMNGMFKGNESLSSIKGLSVWDTSSVVDMASMFRDSKLTELDLSDWDTTSVKQMGSMFYNTNIQQITLGVKFIFASTNCSLSNDDTTWQEVSTGNSYTTLELYSLSRTATSTYVKITLPVLSTNWYKGTTDKATITEIKMVDSYTPTGDETESWDASKAGDGSVMAYLSGTKLTLAGNGMGKIYASSDVSRAFEDFSALTSMDLSIFDTSSAINMYCMFSGCKNLTSITGLSSLDTSSVTNMSYMFQINDFSELDLSGWDTRSVTDMTNMFSFEGLKQITLGANFIFAGTDSSLGSSDYDFAWRDAASGVKCTSKELYAITRNSTTTYVAAPMLNGSNRWYKGTTDKATITEIELVNIYTPTGEETESWDASTKGNFSDGTYYAGDVTAYISGTKLILAGNGAGGISCFDLSSSFYGFTAAQSICGLELLDVSMVKDMSLMFSQCENLTSITGLSTWDTSSVTNMSYMFSNINFTELDLSGWDTSSVTSMNGMFNYGSSTEHPLKRLTLGAEFAFVGENCGLLPEKQWRDTSTNDVYTTSQLLTLTRSSATTYVSGSLVLKEYWYKGSPDEEAITEIELVDSYTPTGEETESWDASVAGDGSVMAYLSGTKVTIAGDGAGKICMPYSTGVNHHFFGFKALQEIKGLALLDLSTTKTIEGMFCWCTQLTSIDVTGWDTSNIVRMGAAFAYCQKLTSITGLSTWDTSSVTSMITMFYWTSVLQELDLSGWDTSSVTSMDNMFGGSHVKSIFVSEKWSVAAVASSTDMFKYCSYLSGAIAYDSTKTDATYANYETGYLTYKAASGTAQSLIDAELPTETVPEIPELVTDPVGDEPENDTPADTVTEIEPLPEETQEDAAPAGDQDEKAAEPPDEGGSAAEIIIMLVLPAVWKGVLYGKTK